MIHDLTPSSTDDAEAWLRVGRLAMQVKAPAEAERFFRQAVALQPGQAGARVQYGLNLLVLDRCDAAIPELAEAARLDPTDPGRVRTSRLLRDQSGPPCRGAHARRSRPRAEPGAPAGATSKRRCAVGGIEGPAFVA